MLDWPDNLADLCLSKDSDCAQIDTVAYQLGYILHSGILAAFIGSGISSIVHLPLWRDLNLKIVQEAPLVLKGLFPKIWTKAIEDKLPTPAEANSLDSDILKILDRVEKTCSLCETLVSRGTGDPDEYVGNAPSWHRLVMRALYGETKNYRFEEMFHPELVSLCGLFMGERRGFIREVFTFNYDDLLESYLRLHGHPCQVVTPLPNRLTPNFGTVFYHPHGYLPLQDNQHHETPFLVLSGQSYDRVYSGARDHIQLWREIIVRILCTRIGLFVGISGKDNVHEFYFEQALQQADLSNSRRPLAFAILMGDTYLPPKQWLSKRIIPLEFQDANSVAKFLAMVCQQAASIVGSP
ncbi:MAG: SIR2 family protein [Planctomycetota bacterium]